LSDVKDIDEIRTGLLSTEAPYNYTGRVG